jgi:hypothetical protein
MDESIDGGDGGEKAGEKVSQRQLENSIFKTDSAKLTGKSFTSTLKLPERN